MLVVIVGQKIIIVLFCHLVAVVRILEKNQKTGEAQLRTATIMRKGTSFGVRSIPIDKHCIGPHTNNNRFFLEFVKYTVHSS